MFRYLKLFRLNDSRIFILFTIIFWLAVCIYLIFFNRWEANRLNEEIFPTIDGGTYSMYNVNYNISLDDDTKNSDVILSLRPGESYDGLVAFKNHGMRENFVFLHDPFVVFTGEAEGEIKPGEEQPAMDYLGEGQSLDAGELVFVDFKLTVPDDFSFGNYKSTFKAYPPDMMNFGKDAEGQTVRIITMVGVDIFLEVTNEPKSYVYENRLSNPKQVALDRTYYHFRLFLLLYFSILSVMFFLKYLRQK